MHERGAAVDELGPLGAVIERSRAHAPDIGLVVLAEIGGEREWDPTLLPDPGDGDGRVETTREGDPYPLSDGE